MHKATSILKESTVKSTWTLSSVGWWNIPLPERTVGGYTTNPQAKDHHVSIVLFQSCYFLLRAYEEETICYSNRKDL